MPEWSMGAGNSSWRDAGKGSEGWGGVRGGISFFRVWRINRNCNGGGEEAAHYRRQ